MRFRSTLLVFSLALSGCAIGKTYGAADGSIPKRPEGAVYRNWQHFCIVVASTNLSKVLNDAGEEGWELVGVDAQGLACFKRPSADDDGAE